MEKITTSKPSNPKKEQLDISNIKPGEQYITLDEYVHQNREASQPQKQIQKPEKRLRLNVAGFSSDMIKDPTKSQTKSTDSLQMFSTTQSVGPPTFSVDSLGSKGSQYQITKNNITGGYIVFLPKLSAGEKFRAESSYSEEIKKIDKKIKRLTNELIDYYIDKKRKARLAKNNKSESDKRLMDAQKNFEFLTNVPNLSEIKGDAHKESGEIVENNTERVLDISQDKEQNEEPQAKNSQIQTDFIPEKKKREKKLPTLLTRKMLEQMQFKDLVISAKKHSIPKFGKVSDRREHLMRVLSKENTKLAAEELKPSHPVKRLPYYDVFDAYMKQAKPLFGEDNRVFPDPLNKNFL